MGGVFSRAAPRLHSLAQVFDAPPRAEDTRSAMPGRSGTSFGYFLCANKKVTRRKAEAFVIEDEYLPT